MYFFFVLMDGSIVVGRCCSLFWWVVSTKTVCSHRWLTWSLVWWYEQAACAGWRWKGLSSVDTGGTTSCRCCSGCPPRNESSLVAFPIAFISSCEARSSVRCHSTGAHVPIFHCFSNRGNSAAVEPGCGGDTDGGRAQPRRCT
ncbi:unnamed protein product [Ectocarpus sp. 6 AP-2014]